ncbi:PREDICTED: acyl-CoA-binding domain-containing protein 4-like isoform X1 [Lupinus angustifolius]|uniref:acyl-CoA-binding domain-containing protein 4-like isoform X1 n=2 Tax=Lupinus angustifolius TaxID=3871 RepID=UPI00092FA8D1|nr:PREDICTED: acyl-CoA-binding domain-containing protein 4-like isoform X1 [Lupinus angustifolius]XP_019441011.1 PREDICTED: acyl-CoA-binding domain-containing protein 4-like isoform X1 [Lupinus angustifolius]
MYDTMSNWWYNNELRYDEWVPIPVSGHRPLPRYKHAAAVVDEKMYIAGGSRNGRQLSDVQVFDLGSLTWSSLKLKANGGEDGDSSSQQILPATSGHSMIRWGEKILLLGGSSKDSSDELMVRYIDIETCQVGVIKTSGSVPVARTGQSATLVGSRVILFGGEDMSRKLLNDVHALDLESMTWDLIETTQTPPTPRYDHAAAIQGERYLLIFGGCSHSIFFNDLHLLDLQTMEWSQPQIQGDLVSPRAGHAGINVDGSWFIVGGGDNKSGCPETLVWNMSKLVWSVLTVVKQKDPLSSEGLSVCSALIGGENHLLAFGGYNGRYSNEIFVLRPKARDSLRPKIFQSPAAAAAAASVSSAYALSKSEKLDFMQLDDINSKPSVNGHRLDDVTVKSEAIKEEKRLLELSIVEVKAENSRLRGEINEVNSTHAELTKELQSVQGQLLGERSRCSNLEAKIAELQKMLESMQSVEDQARALRNQKFARDQETEHAATVQRQSSGGVWRWLGGSGESDAN